MILLRTAAALSMASVLALVLSASSLQSPAPSPQRPAPTLPPIDNDDIGGSVVSDEGPEGGVWVVAESRDTPTRLTRIVVTDDQGRFVVPDLPRAGYELFARGYGLIDSPRVAARPGSRINLKAIRASSEREAAVAYPAAYWLTVMRVPPTGPIHPADLTRTMKGCMECHQLGSKLTREVAADVNGAASHLEAWDERMKRVAAHGPVLEQFTRLRGQRTMFSEWTERVAKGIYPIAEPARPRGIERNVVVTLWDWDAASTAAASDPLDITVNANGRIYGPGRSREALEWFDPAANATGTTALPGEFPFATLDRLGRVWLTGNRRTIDRQPLFCSDRANSFARYFPLEHGGTAIAVFDPKAGQPRAIDTCIAGEDADLDSNGRLYIGGTGVIGWIETERAGRPSTLPGNAQGWCPMVAETTRDRIDFPCKRIAAAGGGVVWCAAGGVNDERIVRVEIGSNPPESCRAEIHRVPAWRDVAGARDVAVDGDGVVWAAMGATDQIASFDRRRCRESSAAGNGPLQCDDAWRFHAIPGPSFSIASPTAGADVVLRGALAARTTDFMQAIAIDRVDVLGLNAGRAVPWTLLSNSGAAAAFLPGTGEFVTLRVPYPLGFYGRSLSPRVDDPRRAWKGRGLWSAYGSDAPSHVEGGAGNKVVKFQLRPDPLAR